MTEPLGDDLSITVRRLADPYTTLDDTEATAEARAAHQAGAWQYVGLQADVLRADEVVGTCALYGIPEGETCGACAFKDPSAMEWVTREALRAVAA